MFTLGMHLRKISLLFIASVFLSVLQVSVAGYQNDDSSLFQILTQVMAEEESEHSEPCHKFKEAKLSVLTATMERSDIPTRFSNYGSTDHYVSVLYEVGSPPPEA